MLLLTTKNQQEFDAAQIELLKLGFTWKHTGTFSLKIIVTEDKMVIILCDLINKTMTWERTMPFLNGMDVIRSCC